jgi:hypothetical protein
MSQSDYLRRKKMSNVLNLDSSADPIYDSKQYLDFKQYQIENQTVSTNVSYRKITPSNVQNILNMEKKVANCPEFLLCDPSTRPNRIPHKGPMCGNTPLNWWEVKEKTNLKQLWCKCQLNRSTTDDNKCSCVVSK